MSYVHLFYITSACNIYIWFLLLYYKWPKRRTNSKKPNVIFLFYRIQICRIFTESTQATELMAEMFVVLFFAKVPFIKYVRWNKPNVFDSESPLYAFWEKMALLNQKIRILARPPPLSSYYPYTCFTDGT